MDLEQVKQDFRTFLATEDGQEVLNKALPPSRRQPDIDNITDAMLLSWIRAHTCLMQRMQKGAQKVGEAKLEKYYSEGGS